MNHDSIDHNISFKLPCLFSGMSMRITLKPWSEGLKPLHMDEYLHASGEGIKQNFNALWGYRLSDISNKIDPVSWQLWLSEIPDDIYSNVIRHELDNIAALYLLCQVKELRNMLSNGHFLKGIIQSWVNDVTTVGLKSSMDTLIKKLSMKRHHALGYEGGAISGEVTSLRIKLLGYIPGSYSFIRDKMIPLYWHNYDVFLPHFFSCPKRFKEKLNVLNAFYTACRHASIPSEYAAPLFSRVIRQRTKVRANNLTLLFIRLKGALEVLQKNTLRGLLNGAPSIRFLEKYSRRIERQIHNRHVMLDVYGTSPQNFSVTGLLAVNFIEPILDRKDLIMEGFYMSNCIASFEEGIILGVNAAFRMRWPERATILLEKDGDKWVINQAQDFNNNKLNETGMVILNKWIEGSIPQDLPENMPPYFPDRKINSIRDWSYHREISRWEQLTCMPQPLEYDVFLWQMIDSPSDDDFENYSDGMDFDCIDTCKIRLPDTIDGWSRITTAQQLSLVGFDQDMLSPLHVSNVQGLDKSVYINPALTLAYVVVHSLSKFDLNIEVVKHRYAKWQGMTIQGQYLVESLRSKLYAFSKQLF